MIYAAAAALIALCAAACTARLLAGPTLYDRAIAASAVIAKAALMCATLGAGLSQPALIDAALGLLIAGFVANAATMKFFRFRSFQVPAWRAESDARGGQS